MTSGMAIQQHLRMQKQRANIVQTWMTNTDGFASVAEDIARVV